MVFDTVDAKCKIRKRQETELPWSPQTMFETLRMTLYVEVEASKHIEIRNGQHPKKNKVPHRKRPIKGLMKRQM